MNQQEWKYFDDLLPDWPQYEEQREKCLNISSPSTCPSLSTSFLSIDTSPDGTTFEHNSTTRLCMTSSPVDACSGSSATATSPMTPSLSGISHPLSMLMHRIDQSHMPDPSFHGFSTIFGEQGAVWRPDISYCKKSSYAGNSHHFPMGNSFDNECEDVYGFNSEILLPGNPVLSRQIFGGDCQQLPLIPAHNQMLDWQIRGDSDEVQTIAPSITFQPIQTSSPMSRTDPSTPYRNRILASTLVQSSPTSLISPKVVPSQNEMIEADFELLEGIPSLAENLRKSRMRPSRLSKRNYEKKKSSSKTCKPRPVSTKSGFDCEVIIAQNEFACSYKDCIDKDTGKPKRFKRQEHKKRHEKTVHERTQHEVHKCWVPLCKTPAFTRTDNLKSHLRNTHGRRSANQRNRYVATQDRNSEHYNPDWVGDLTPEGFPSSEKSHG